MSCHQAIATGSLPKQGKFAGRRVEVVFRYMPTKLPGTVVRDDAEYPNVTIIRLDDGRHVLGSECEFRVSING